MVRVNSTDVAISANGTVTLLSGQANGTTYTVTVVTQPSTPAQVCTVTNASGTVSGSNVTNVAIPCTSAPLSLSSSTPVIGSSDALRTVAPVLTFSASLDAATAVPDNISLRSAAGSQPITLNVSGRDLVVTPSKTLLPLAAYTITVGMGLRGSDGESLAGPVTVTFTTEDGHWQTGALLPNALLPSIPPEADTSSAVNPQIAFDSNGDAVAVWEHSDGTSRVSRPAAMCPAAAGEPPTHRA